MRPLPLPGPEACWGYLGPPAPDHQIPGEIAHIYAVRDRHILSEEALDLNELCPAGGSTAYA